MVETSSGLIPSTCLRWHWLVGRTRVGGLRCHRGDVRVRAAHDPPPVVHAVAHVIVVPEHSNNRDRACAQVLCEYFGFAWGAEVHQSRAMTITSAALDISGTVRDGDAADAARHAGRRAPLPSRVPSAICAAWVAFVVLSSVKTRAPASARVMRGRGSRSHHGRQRKPPKTRVAPPSLSPFVDL